MIADFLQEELSEVHLGLCSGARAHLERFRTLLRRFYAAKLGYYLPPAMDSPATIFEEDLFRAMRGDFEALYEYLVDKNFDISQGTPFKATGGICTLQIIGSFDRRHKFRTLSRSLPLLPEVETNGQRRMTLLTKHLRTSCSQQTQMHMALLKATNKSEPRILDSELVKAYQQFEKDSVYSATKAEKPDNLGPVDARKVRWILIYSMYQALRRATEPPSEATDAKDVPCNLCTSAALLPPWKGDPPLGSIPQNQTHQISGNPSESSSDWDSGPPAPPTDLWKVRPDIDYFAITHPDNAEIANGSETTREIKGAGRRISLGRNLSLAPALRRSWIILTQQPQPAKKATQLAQGVAQGRLLYHESLVHGYGHGTNPVEAALEATLLPVKPHTIADTTSSSPSRFSDISSYSTLDRRGTGTPDSSIINDRLVTPQPDRCASWRNSVCESCRPSSSCAGVSPRLGDPSDDNAVLPVSPIDSKPRPYNLDPYAPLPLNIRNLASSWETPPPGYPTAWDYVEPTQQHQAIGMMNDHKPVWEQYADLSGLTEPILRSKPATPRKRWLTSNINSFSRL
ncbi:hypothetical protein DL762_003716 [Monosporascus cannonballus]|uniref:Uncharacterized protein n=1 Tax=Monosporascus cannonballus TaxID=155416 RepID=A0ABY0HB22_9PEZI|nr:hypothetical protein DL762_003716 [Monosporascus cannonballus]